MANPGQSSAPPVDKSPLLVNGEVDPGTPGGGGDAIGDALFVDYLTRADLAKQIGVSVLTLAKWAAQGKGPVPVRVGSKIYYRVGAVRDWMIKVEQARSKSFRSR